MAQIIREKCPEKNFPLLIISTVAQVSTNQQVSYFKSEGNTQWHYLVAMTVNCALSYPNQS